MTDMWVSEADESGQGFNFPLNLIATVAELFIGFLVAAESDRSERSLERALALLSQVDQDIADVRPGSASYWRRTRP